MIFFAGAPSWLFKVPHGLRSLLNWIKDSYHDPEIIITENGFSEEGEHERTGAEALRDTVREDYIRDYTREVLKACTLDGVKVKGYFAWSLMDNFEWSDGYKFRFGLHRVDFDDPRRTRVRKNSANFYKSLIANNGYPASRIPQSQ